MNQTNICKTNLEAYTKDLQEEEEQTESNSRNKLKFLQITMIFLETSHHKLSKQYRIPSKLIMMQPCKNRKTFQPFPHLWPLIQQKGRIINKFLNRTIFNFKLLY